MPQFGVSNDLIVTHVVETTTGVTPANPVLKRLRVNGETLNANVTFDESPEINPNYSLSDIIATGQAAGGGIPFDLAKEAAMDEILEAVLRGTWTANILNGGTVRRSFTIEKTLQGGGTAKYVKFAGSRYNGITIEGSVGSRLTGSIDVMSLTGIDGLTSIIGTGSVTQPANNRVMSMVDLTSVTLTGDTTPIILSKFSLGITNNCRIQQGHGQLAGYDIGYGMREVTFTASAYFETFEQLDKMIARSTSNLTLVISDGTNSYTIRLPKLKYRKVDITGDANNADLMQDIEGRALYDPTAGVLTDIRITRTP